MIFKGSRYAKTDLYVRGEVTGFERRDLFNFNLDNSLKHTVIQSDTLPNLAKNYYDDPQLWWVILEANPKYSTISDINIGDIIYIPSKEEVIKLVE